jgi:hypothetical protein
MCVTGCDRVEKKFLHFLLPRRNLSSVCLSICLSICLSVSHSIPLLRKNAVSFNASTVTRRNNGLAACVHHFQRCRIEKMENRRKRPTQAYINVPILILCVEHEKVFCKRRCSLACQSVPCNIPVLH